ncbi:MAG TPA: hypothetical protein VF177_11925 [Anaerolineae bacterium]
MNRLRIAFLLSSVLVLSLVSAIFADYTVVKYDDTDLDGYETSAGNLGSYVLNGDFSLWDAEGLPEGWSVWSQDDRRWETHIGQMTLGPGNYGLSIFIRHTGGKAPEYAGIRQKLEAIPSPGYYWIDLHVSAWEQGVTSAYNSGAWYAISTERRPGDVTEWREMFPDVYVCPNGEGACNYLARKETVWIEPDNYLHIRVGHNFRDFGAFTVFGLDDISIVAADGTTGQPSGWIDDGDVTWDPNADR